MGLTTPCSGSVQQTWYVLQVILIVNVVVYLALSFVTLPLYSLGVQMGSDFRPHILTPNIKNRLLDIAHANKEKVTTCMHDMVLNIIIFIVLSLTFMVKLSV